MNKIYLFPLWLRIWHWITAILFLASLVTGLNLQYSHTIFAFIPVPVALAIHNISGILISITYLFFLILNFTSGNFKSYLPKFGTFFKDLFTQIGYYLFGVFDKRRNPFPVDKENKFNPVLKITYLKMMYLLLPLMIVTGWLLLFPVFIPDTLLGLGGVWSVSLLHIFVGFSLFILMFLHIYLASIRIGNSSKFSAMITGWYPLPQEEITSENISSVSPDYSKGRKLFPPSVYNPITLAGAFLAIISFVIFLFLMAIDILSASHNLYLGIITFTVLPGILIIGLVLIAFGIFREKRIQFSSPKKERRFPVLDFNNPKHQIATLVFSIGTMVLVIFTAFGSFKAYEYTESDEFCGTLCHTVMEPEYVTYQRSPHSNVGCVKCHIGSGADWFVKSKLSGAYQFYAVLVNNYPRPIHTPVENLRPAQETCEQCHWPSHFYDEKRIVRDYYLSDEKNSKYNLEMLVKTGGGNVEIGNTDGIHWHMNLANEITYYPADRQLQIIPWVKSVNKATGEETIYKLKDYDISDNIANSNDLRKMDCIDCHNRPAHKYNPPTQIVNLYMAINRIDPNIPYIKNISVQALESNIHSSKDAFTGISRVVWNFYNNKYPDLNEETKSSINRAISALVTIYQNNYFPAMNSSWKDFPDNLGHMHSPGCFRCHSGNHVSPNGKVITNDCNACHTFKSEIIPTDFAETKTVVNEFVHPGDTDIKGQNCVVCHGTKRYDVNDLYKLTQK